MSRHLRWACDGCDCEESTDADKQPIGWSTITVALGGFRYNFTRGNAAIDFDLCGLCQGRLIEQANPRRWPRAALAKADAP